MPAAASASGRCHQLTALTGVASYKGTASTAYASGSHTGPPGESEFQETTSLSRSASNLQIANVKRKGVGFIGTSTPTGGTVQVDDTYSDNFGGVSTQTASGPTEHSANGVQILIDSAKCTYQVLISFEIKTNTVQNHVDAPPEDPGVGDSVVTPAARIPSSLDLHGSASVLASGSGGDIASAGFFDLSGDPAWSTVLEGAVGFGQPLGNASVSWSLKPVMAKKHKHHG